MGRFPLLAVIATAVLAGCAGLPAQGNLRYGATSASPLEGGDLVVAVARGARHHVVRVRPGRAMDGTGRVQTTGLLALEGPADALAASPDGRWLAAAVPGASGASEVALYDLAAGQTSPEWTSPAGCGGPTFHPRSHRLVLACDAPAPGHPAYLLLVTLADARDVLALVGERDRGHPAFGVGGDLYFTERDADHTRILRRASDRLPYVTHETVQPIRALWPQEDGSVLAELAMPGTRREFVRLLASGVVRDEAPPALVHREPPRDAPLVAATDGDWYLPMCERGPCVVVQVGPEGGASVPVALGGTPTAIGRIARLDRPVPHPEDLATAPAEVLSSHAAPAVAVLGVELGTPLETAFSTLDRAGRHPYWIEGRGPRDLPRGIGIGYSTAGHCIEYLADDRGVVVTVDLRSCAGHYLSPTLRPLLDRDALADDGGLELARRFLGPGVEVTVGGGDRPRGTAPILRTELVYTAPDRGYHFEAHAEMLQSGRLRLLGGTVWLRLQLPGRRTAAIRP